MGYWACGFAFMFGGHGPFPALGGPGVLDAMASVTLFGHRWDLLGYSGFFLGGPAGEASVLAVFVFQAMFADTAATIPTGAMAERWKFTAFLAYGFVASMVIYPVFGCWAWGNGWLADLGRDVRAGQRTGRLRRLERRPHDRRPDGPGGFAGARASDRQVQQERHGQRDPRPQRPDGGAGHPAPGLRLVRVQRRAGPRRDRPPDRLDRDLHLARHRRRVA